MAITCNKDFRIRWYVPRINKTVEPDSPGSTEEKNPRKPEIKNKKREVCVFEKFGVILKKIKNTTAVKPIMKRDFFFLSVNLKSLGREAAISPVNTEYTSKG